MSTPAVGASVMKSLAQSVHGGRRNADQAFESHDAPAGDREGLTDLIVKRVWKPGDLIPSERELATRFQIERSTIREGVKSVVVLGVLEARAGEGSFVREPTSGRLSGGFRWGLLL